MDLKKDFNHTFDRLEAIICWGSRVKDGERHLHPNRLRLKWRNSVNGFPKRACLGKGLKGMTYCLWLPLRTLGSSRFIRSSMEMEELVG